MQNKIKNNCAQIICPTSYKSEATHELYIWRMIALVQQAGSIGSQCGYTRTDTARGSERERERERKRARARADAAQVRINSRAAELRCPRWGQSFVGIGSASVRLRLRFGFLARLKNHVLICFDYAHFAFETFLIESFVVSSQDARTAWQARTHAPF